MIPIKFNRAIGDKQCNFFRWQETDGFVAFEKYGYTFVVHEEIESTAMDSFIAFEISEVSTGFCINFDTPALSAQDAIDRAWKFLEEKGEELTKKVIADAKLIIQGNAPEPTPEPPSATPSGSEADQPQ